MNKGGFSWKRATGVTRAKQRIARQTGIPLTKSGRQRKVGRMTTGGGCLVPVLILIAIALAACSAGPNAAGLGLVTTPGPTIHPTSPTMVAPTAPPTVAPTAVPTPAPTPTDQPAIAVTFSSITSPIDAGKTAKATVKTTAGALCDIDVVYESGSSTAAGLDDKTAPANGSITWTWVLGANTNPGTRSVEVYCILGEATGTAIRALVVR